MRKYQQGGVFDPISVRTPDVGGIAASPIIDIPVPGPINLPGMANLAIDAERRRRQADQDAIAQQGRLDSSIKEFRSLQDALVGEVHNPYQAKLLEAAKQRHGIDDGFYQSVDFGNINDVKAHTNKIYEYINDKDVLEVMGQVGVANKLRTMSPANMTQEEQDAWMKANETYDNAATKDVSDPRIVDPRRYNLATPKANKVPNFASTVTSVLGPIAGQIDITDPNQRQRVHNIIADSWAAQDGPGAVEAGLIILPPDGGLPTLTPLGQRIADERTAAYANTYMVKRADEIEDATTVAHTRDDIGDANREEAARLAREKALQEKTAGATKEEVEVARNYWDKALSYNIDLDKEYKWVKPEEYPWLMDKIMALSASSAAGSTPADKAKELYKLVDEYFTEHPDQDPRVKPEDKPSGPPELKITVDKTGPKTIKKDANGKIIY